MLNSKEILQPNEKYKFGGSQSLRGFDENHFIADKYIFITNTLRYLLTSDFNIFTLYDTGYYQYNTEKNKLTDTPSNIGIGLGIKHQKSYIDIAWIINKEYHQYQSISKAKLNISLKMRF
ncbi:MAG: hypothetical protein MJ211_13885 [Bacteroidales bacterium]|nr:hypothetical protein [Bacteroidales bacterium]